MTDHGHSFYLPDYYMTLSCLLSLWSVIFIVRTLYKYYATFN